jgi:hypothetical protein
VCEPASRDGYAVAGREFEDTLSDQAYERAGVKESLLVRSTPFPPHTVFGVPNQPMANRVLPRCPRGHRRR